MSITLNVSAVRDISVVAARTQWERARDRHEDACARRDALAHRVLLHLNANECLDWLTAETSALLKEWLDCTLDAVIALETRRDALGGYTRALDGLIEDVRSVIKASAVQS